MEGDNKYMSKYIESLRVKRTLESGRNGVNRKGMGKNLYRKGHFVERCNIRMRKNWANLLFSCLVMSDSLPSHELQRARLPCWRRQWHPTPVLLPRKSHGWRSLVGCSPWGC